MAGGSKDLDQNSREMFSRVYLRPTTAHRDSERFRRRLFAGFSEFLRHGDEFRAFSQQMRRELGVSVPNESPAVYYDKFFLKAEVRDVLDAISIIGEIIDTRTVHGALNLDGKEWRKFVSRVFIEEGLGYVLNERGGVRFRVDEEYERNRFAVIDGMANPRYAAVKHAVESAFARLDAGADTKAAVREMFEAAETLAKLMADVREDLDERMVQRRLKPMAQKLYGEDPAAAAFADQMLEGFAKWVNAGHKYRHGHRTSEPIAVPIDMAVAYLSTGASHLRFLLVIDQLTIMFS